MSFCLLKRTDKFILLLLSTSLLPCTNSEGGKAVAAWS